MKHIVTGIVAHVDAGKTTLSEALLYAAGTIRTWGRVDKGDAFLDNDALEKKRGITIFSHQAELQTGDLAVTLLDTPGHVDFAAQMEAVLPVLDYAILVVSATDGVPGYTRTLWHLLARYRVPVFIWVNKIDAPGADPAAVLALLQKTLAPGCTDFTLTDAGQLSEAALENAAVQDDTVLTDFLTAGTLSDTTVQRLIHNRQVFPVYFGSALKRQGITAFLAGLQRWTQPAQAAADFGARVFKITHDTKGERLTWVRVTGGTLQARQVVLDDEKANQLRVYNGEKFTLVQTVPAGGVCAMTGFTDTYPGQGLGAAQDSPQPELQPVLTYALDPQGNDIHACLTAMRQLADEDPQLHVSWSESLQEIRVRLMGEIQLTVLRQMLADRFNLQVDFVQGHILYKETITAAGEGAGHFEPLRHYAEVHLLLRPGQPGSGLVYDSTTSTETLPQNWQHQVLTSLQAKEQLGVLIGAPITDMRITLVTGRGSIVHTVGGDFREAGWRALRQGLMVLASQNHCVVLEPWYDFRLTITRDQVGRAMNDIQRISGTIAETEDTAGGTLTVLTGTAPVSEMQSYTQEVTTYTHGEGSLEYVVAGYRPAHNADTVIAEATYNPTSDLANPPGSVFVAHGAAYTVNWDKVPATMHLPYVYTPAQLAAMTDEQQS
ncbi:GTP-binding protein [Schleiferilactobacillus harbinensis]|uniref:elongation factor G n=1 Tax=Schleiferilactobacillus harbinensis TaxID=304207 RepID=UPI0021A2DB28|nr:TetM/TetW/TetO/TetS family tetracycline resistance ribosomal protection protein [Schleiferilactobacillus harbinensis]MCT2907678.1 GTP-binding protein [Schleiferilactobacillus harbinensis]